MVALLLQGSRSTTLVSGVEALTDAEVSLLERVRHLSDPGVLWTLADKFIFDVEVSKHVRTGPTESLSVTRHYHTVSVNVSGTGTTTGSVYDSGTGPDHVHGIVDFVLVAAAGTGQSPHVHDLISTFPDLPIVLQRNVALVLQALDPAHTLYEYRNLFRESLRGIVSDSVTAMDLSSDYYDDFRKDCTGVRSLGSSNGIVGADRYLFHDSSLSFRSVRVGAELVIPVSPAPSPSSHLPREHRYRVSAVVPVPYGDDPVPRAYTTSPSSLSGFLTVAGEAFTDPSQNFAATGTGETLTIHSGPNAGTYLLETLLGSNGGPVGEGVGPATSVRPAPSYLRVAPRIETPGTGITYTVSVDRLGVQTPETVANEDVSVQFYGNGVQTFTTIRTAFGPLVKRWGDSTPAEVTDVTVRYDGSPLNVVALNPYTGEVVVSPAVTSFSPGAHTVTVSYSWFRAPVAGLAGLNRKGLVLNKWDLRSGRNTTSPSQSATYRGTPTSRFPMGVVLGRFPRRRPALQIAHRFIGFEKGYTAAINSPTTLLLNQAPGRTSVAYATADVSPQSILYQGSELPTTPWSFVGNPSGFVNGDFFTLADGDPTEVAYWKRDFPLPVSANVSLAARLAVTAYEPDGVFTGVGFGFHNNRRLFFAGALSVPNPNTGERLRHVGILLRPGNLSDLDSWTIGPSASGEIQVPPHGATVGTVTIPTVTLPTLLTVGNKFQVLSGSQTGVYAIEDFYQSLVTGKTTLIVSPAFPEDPSLFGNRDVTLYFDTAWDAGPSTWRLYANTRSGDLTVVFGGASGSSTSVGAGTLASPAYLGPDILPEGYGRVLWGSIDRAATNSSSWEFLRGASTPDGAYTYSRGTVIDTTMTTDPENGEWYRETPFGDSRLFSGYLFLTSTPADSGLGTSYGYGYTDPFLTGRRVSAFDAKVLVDRDTAGVGGATLVLHDTHREVRLATIRYRINGFTGKSIYRLDTVSLVGSVPYYVQGWGGNATTETFANGPDTRILGDGVTPWALDRELVPQFSPCTGRFLEFRVAVHDPVFDGSGRISLTFGGLFGGRSVYLDFRTGAIVLSTSPNGGAVDVVTIPWVDGEPRTYRIVHNVVAATLDLYVEGTLEATVALSSFSSGSLTGVEVRHDAHLGGRFSADLNSVCYGGTEEGITDLYRTFGLFLGGDEGDIDNWSLPRTDGFHVPNSDPSSTITDMDWRSECWVRVLLDPTFGAAFIRPDLSPPPGYVGDFATQSMNPSSGWVKVEYANLPRVAPGEKFGTVSFGALNPSGSVESIWNEVRYRVFTNTSVDYAAPQGMVLNRWNVITSGDSLRDRTPQEVVVASVSPTRVALRPCHIFADRVFAVRVDNSTLPNNLWRFNRDSQELTLVAGVPSAGYPVNVVFAPGKPVTTSYLFGQPFPESQTFLNEGTPPIEVSRAGSTYLSTVTGSTVSGDGGPTPLFPPTSPSNPDYFLRDQYLVRNFEDDPDALYERLELFSLEDGGQRGRIASYCDGGGPREISISGSSFSDSFGGMGAAGRGRGPGVYRYSLMASGNGFDGGVIGTYRFDDRVALSPHPVEVSVEPFSTGAPPPSTEAEPRMLYATSPSGNSVRGAGGGARYRETLFVMKEGSSPGTVSIWTGGSRTQTWG